MTASKTKRKNQSALGQPKSAESKSKQGVGGLRGNKNKMQSYPTTDKLAGNRKPREASYVPPTSVVTSTVGELLAGVRKIPEQQQERLGIADGTRSGSLVWMAGDISLVKRPCVAVVGARNVSGEGAARARRLARELSNAGVVVVSGLAKGVDTEALTAAFDANGRTIAVIGTPIDRAYPAENKRLQERIYRDHLLISQFPPGKRVFPSNFPERNKLMAAISDATVIIEASDTSGSLHQAAECVRLGRWLFITKSLMENPSLLWPKNFMQYPNTKILTRTSEITDLIGLN